MPKDRRLKRSTKKKKQNKNISSKAIEQELSTSLEQMAGMFGGMNPEGAGGEQISNAMAGLPGMEGLPGMDMMSKAEPKDMSNMNPEEIEQAIAEGFIYVDMEIKKLEEDAKAPDYEGLLSNFANVYSYKDTILKPCQAVPINTKIKIELPAGFAMLFFLNESVFSGTGISLLKPKYIESFLNDEEVIIWLVNPNPKDVVRIKANTPIAKFMIVPMIKGRIPIKEIPKQEESTSEKTKSAKEKPVKVKKTKKLDTKGE